MLVIVSFREFRPHRTAADEAEQTSDPSKKLVSERVGDLLWEAKSKFFVPDTTLKKSVQPVPLAGSTLLPETTWTPSPTCLHPHQQI